MRGSLSRDELLEVLDELLFPYSHKGKRAREMMEIALQEIGRVPEAGP